MSTGGGEIPSSGRDITPREYELIDEIIRTAMEGVSSHGSAPPQKYDFFPQGGILGGDLWLNNYTDLDSSGGVLDWDCSDYTYDSHRGYDSDLRSFDEQMAGVPIFAALGGTIASVHDGEPDMNTSCAGSPIGNHVIIDHGNGHQTAYWHFKRNSIAVSPGQVVTAGTHLGDTGSSGCSTSPHLHFESMFNGSWFEPSTGPCHPGESAWSSQEPVIRAPYIRDFTFSNSSPSGWTPPWGFPSRSGYVLSGTRTLYYAWLQQNLPPRSTWQVLFRRPNGSIAYDSGSRDFNNPTFYRASNWWHNWTLNLDALGTWRAELFVNGQRMVDAPFTVVASIGEMVNRGPNDLDQVRLEPSAPGASDALRCRVSTSLTLDDPDYDLVTYRYVWQVAGNPVRDVVHAGHMDVLARGVAAPGDLVSCTVTPMDSVTAGNSRGASVVVEGGGPPPTPTPPQPTPTPVGGTPTPTPQPGEEVAFIHCVPTSPGALQYDCSIASACGGLPCGPDQWSPIAGQPTLPASFFQPGGGRGSAIQVTPFEISGAIYTLVSKDIGGKRWAIIENRNSGVVTGNIFGAGGGAVQFILCADVTEGSGVAVFGSCFVSQPCSASGCQPSDWQPIASTPEIAASFFSPGPARGSGLQRTPTGAEILISKDLGSQRWTITTLSEPASGNFPIGLGPVFGNVFDRGASSCDAWSVGLAAVPGGSACTLQVTVDNEACVTDLSEITGEVQCGNGSADLADSFQGVTFPAGSRERVSVRVLGCRGFTRVLLRSGGATKVSNDANCG